MYEDFHKSMSRKRYCKMMRAKLTEAYIHGMLDKETLNEFYKRLGGDTNNWVIRIASAHGYPKNFRVNYRERYDVAADKLRGMSGKVDGTIFAHENF